MCDDDIMEKVQKGSLINIPQSILDYIGKILKSGRRRDYLSLKIQNSLNYYDEIFYRASAITKLSISNLIACTDFETNDLSIERFLAMIAEIKTIVLLDEMKFKKIAPLKMLKNTREADFIAKYNDDMVCVETTCICHNTKKWTEEEYVNQILKKCLKNDKIIQLKLSSEKYNCIEGILVVDIEGEIKSSIDIERLNNILSEKLSMEDFKIYAVIISDNLN